METRSASAFSDARDSTALLIASCKLSFDCARAGGNGERMRNNTHAEMLIPRPKDLIDDFTYLLAWCINHLRRLWRKDLIFAITPPYLGFIACHFCLGALGIKNTSTHVCGQATVLAAAIMRTIKSYLWQRRDYTAKIEGGDRGRRMVTNA